MAYSLATIPFALHAAPSLHRFFTRELTRVYRIAQEHSPNTACPALHVREGQAVSPAPHDRTMSYPQGGGWLTDGRFTLQTDQAHVEVQLQPALQVSLTLHTPPNQQTHIEFGYALQALLRYRGRFTAHAAAVIEPRTQTGMLLLGASGSGKTTTALQLVRQGWRYLSDDLLLLGETDTGIAAWGLRRVFAATEKTLAACDYVGAQRPAGLRMGADIEKLAFDPQTLFPTQYAEQCVPQHLLFVEVADQSESELLPLTPRIALEQLLPQSPWACFDADTTHQHLNVLLRLSQQAQGWTLKAGRDWLERPADVAAWLIARLCH